MSEIIKVQNLHKTYLLSRGKGGFEALKGISFEVEKGEIFGILGPNGAGKTTTLEIIEGLKGQSSGKIEVLGFDNLKNSFEIKKRIGVQLQSSGYLPYLTLGELLNLFASLYNSPNPSYTKREGKQELLQLVGLEDKENEVYHNLSGGQKQRFTIATSLVHSPEILFLDEPTTGLDPAARRNLWKFIKEINQKGMAIVLTTHYMEEAEFLCNRVAIMDQGKILEIDEPNKLIDRLSETTQISFLVNEKIDKKIFDGFSEIEKIYEIYPKVILEIQSLDHISEIVDLLKKHQISFSGFTVKTASLEDVYLDLTGHEFEE